MKQFDDWNVYAGASEGSGRSEKIWLINSKTDEIGIFKFPKTAYTYEHMSEKLATDIASLIGLPHAKVEIGEYNNRIGSMSYQINKNKEDIIEGIHFISSKYPSYNPDKLFDMESNTYYSFDMIISSLESFKFSKDFLSDLLKILIFDFIIGNTDRHQSNWALLLNDKIIKMCPIYDNGSSLCCYIEDSKIDSYLGKDINRFRSLVDTKSTSRIRIEKSIKKEPSHLTVIKYINNNYRDEVIKFVTKACKNINLESINNILSNYNNETISLKRKELIGRFVSEKMRLLESTFY